MVGLVGDFYNPPPPPVWKVRRGGGGILNFDAAGGIRVSQIHV